MASIRGRYAHLDVLVLVTGLWFLAKLLRYAFPPLFEPLQGIYGVSTTEIGFAYAGLLAVYAAMQFPAGIFGDRIGSVRVMVSGAILAGVAAMTLIADAGFALLVLVMLVIGVGTGLHKTVSVVLLGRVYPRHTGRALGIHETFGASAGVVAPIAAVGFLGWVGWRPLFLVAGVAVVGIATLATVRIPPRLPTPTADRSIPRSTPSLRRYLRLFRHRGFSLFVLFTVFFALANGGVVAFLPLYLVAVADLSVGTAGLLYSVFFAATVVQLGTGELSDRMGELPMLGGCVALATVGLSAFLVAGDLWSLTAAAVVFGIGSHGYRPVRDAYMRTIVPTDAVGGGIGLMRTVLMGAAAIAPAAVGVIADTVGFRPAFALLAASLVVSLGVLALLFLVTDR